MLQLFLLFAATAVGLVIWKRWNDFRMRDQMGLKGPPFNYVLGNLVEFAATKNPHEVLAKWRKIYGNTFGYYAGPKLFVAVHDLDMIKQILSKQFSCFVDRMDLLLLPKVVCRSVVGLKHDKWKPVRIALSPTMSGTKLKQMMPIMMEKSDVFLERCAEFALKGEPFDILDTFSALTLAVVAQCAFAVDSNCQRSSDDVFLRNAQNYIRSQDFSTSKLATLAVTIPELNSLWTQIQEFTALGAAEKVVYDSLKEVYNHRKSTFKEFKGTDIVQLLLKQQKDFDDDTNKGEVLKLSDADVMANLFSLLIAGYETTSTALGFTAWLLAKYPNEQRKLQNEIDDTFPNLSDITYDTLHKMEFLDAVYKESMRIFPPIVTFTARTCIKECNVSGIHFVPGVQVMIPVYTIHHDPDIWPEPDKFKPERFMNNQDQHVMAWLPFGDGPRNCIGMRFAELEMKASLVKLLKNFTIEKGADFEDPLTTTSVNLLLRPTNGVKVTLKKRSA